MADQGQGALGLLRLGLWPVKHGMLSQCCWFGQGQSLAQVISVSHLPFSTVSQHEDKCQAGFGHQIPTPPTRGAALSSFQQSF